jgi:hypothetical protein
MGWEDRKGKGQYYTRSARVGGRVVRQYLRSGKRGKAARRAAEEDQERRRKEREKRQRERIELARLREIGDRMEDYYRRVNAVVESTLALAGYQRHSRSEWRKTRQPESTRKEEKTMAKSDKPAKKPAQEEAPAGTNAPADKRPPLSPEDNQIILRAQNGDKTARADTREIIKRYGPRGMYPLTEIARDDLLKKMSGKDIMLQEDVRFQMESLRAQLVEPGGSPLEQLLADRIALCWLHLHYFEVLWAQTLGEVSQKQSTYYEQGLESAHRRYLSAIRSLAQVRRLRLPALQLNLANQQINLADRQVNVGPTSG